MTPSVYELGMVDGHVVIKSDQRVVLLNMCAMRKRYISCIELYSLFYTY